MTSLQPTQAQYLGCIRKGATVTTSSMWAVKLLGSYLTARQTHEHTYTDTNAGLYSSFPGHVGGAIGSGLRTYSSPNRKCVSETKGRV